MSKILIVDDDADFRDSMAMHFQDAGHAVTSVPNGREALAAVITDTPDVVLLDLLMPEMDGPSFLEVVRSYLRLRSLPVVVLTALGESPMVDRTQALKVKSVLVKGRATTADILRAVEDALVRHPG